MDSASLWGKLETVQNTSKDALNTSKDALLRLNVPVRSAFRYLVIPSDQARRWENVWLLCWMLKDIGWALYFGPLAWSAAIIAITLQLQDVLHQWETAPVVEFVHSLATLAWLGGSSVWMTVALLFDPEVRKGRASPWYSGSIFTASPERYQSGLFLMQTIDVAALLGLLIFYATTLQSLRAKAQDPTGDAIRQRKEALTDTPAPAATQDMNTQHLVFRLITPQVYSKLWIAPWILKDLFWTSYHFVPAMICMMFVTVLMADYLFLFMKWKNLAVLLWTTGTAVWVAHDLVMHDQEIWPLLLSVLLFAVGACILGAEIVKRDPRQDDLSKGSKEETAPLIEDSIVVPPF